MEEYSEIIQRLRRSDVGVSSGEWMSLGFHGFVKSNDHVKPTTKTASQMVKVASSVAIHPKIHDHKKKKMHVHIGGPMKGLSEVTVVEITPKGIVRNRFYRVRCEDRKTYRRLLGLAKIRHWGNLFKMITALRSI